MVKSEYMAEDSELVCMSGDEEWDTLEDRSEFGKEKEQDGRRCLLKSQGNIEVLVNEGNGRNGSGNDSAVSSCVSSTTDGGSSMNGDSTAMLSPNMSNCFAVDDKRLRRQIANCNERRRMQSINAGFQSLRHLLPIRQDREKMSKAAILQQTADFIHTLQMEKDRLAEENEFMTRSKRRRLDNFVEERIEDLGKEDTKPDNLKNSGNSSSSSSSSLSVLDYLRTIDELRTALTKEQKLRVAYEQELRKYEKEVFELRSANDKMHNEVSNIASQKAASNPTQLFDASNYLGSFQSNNSNRIQEKDSLSSTYNLLLNSQHEPAIICSALSAIASLQGNIGQNQPIFGGIDQGLGIHSSSLLCPKASIQPGVGVIFNNQRKSAFGSPVSNPSKMEESSSSTTSNISSLEDSSSSAGTSSLSQRNLQSILEAIRHIEGTSSSTVGSPNQRPHSNNSDLLVN